MVFELIRNNQFTAIKASKAEKHFFPSSNRSPQNKLKEPLLDVSPVLLRADDAKACLAEAALRNSPIG